MLHRAEIRGALIAEDGSVPLAAERLGVSVSFLRDTLKRDPSLLKGKDGEEDIKPAPRGRRKATGQRKNDSSES